MAILALVLAAQIGLGPAAAEAKAVQAKRGTAKASIIAGYTPAASQWPWMAGVVLTKDPTTDYCGGAVVAPDRVLTAAHCVYGKTAAEFQVVVGRKDLTNTATGETVPVARIVIHPGYAKRADATVYNDVAMLTLQRPVAVSPATLGTETDWSSAVTVMGWGHINHLKDEYSSNKLWAVDLATWTDAQCAAAWGGDYAPTVNFCAGGDGVHATCHGDSGGPLMVTPDEGVTWKLIGVVSWGPTVCLEYGKPGVYTWVAGPALRPWVLAALVEPLPAAPPVGGSPAPAPAPAPARSAPFIDKRQALMDLRYLVKRKAHSKPRGLSSSCVRKGSASFRCSVSFAASSSSFRGVFKVRAFYGDDGVLYWTGSFNGVKSNGSKVRWRI